MEEFRMSSILKATISSVYLVLSFHKRFHIANLYPTSMGVLHYLRQKQLQLPAHIKKSPPDFCPRTPFGICLRFWVSLMDLPPLVSGGVLRRIDLMPPVFRVLPLPICFHRLFTGLFPAKINP